jgi:UDP-glucose 4-epimerase
VGQALRNESLTVYGDGKQSRTFTHVKDVVKALMGLMQEAQAVGEVFNIGGTEETTILELAEKIIAKTNSDSEISLIPYEDAFEKDFEDMQRRVPGIEKIKKLIEFNPQHELDTILDDVIDYLKVQQS